MQLKMIYPDGEKTDSYVAIRDSKAAFEMSEIAMCNPRAFARGKQAISDDHQKCEAFLRCPKTLFRTLVRGVFDSSLYSSLEFLRRHGYSISLLK